MMRFESAGGREGENRLTRIPVNITQLLDGCLGLGLGSSLQSHHTSVLIVCYIYLTILSFSEMTWGRKAPTPYVFVLPAMVPTGNSCAYLSKLHDYIIAKEQTSNIHPKKTGKILRIIQVIIVHSSLASHSMPSYSGSRKWCGPAKSCGILSLTEIAAKYFIFSLISISIRVN